MPSLDMTLCRIAPAATLAPVRPAPLCDRSELILDAAEQVELSLDVVVRCGSRADTGRQPLHEPATRYSDQLPLHRTQLLQRHCA